MHGRPAGIPVAMNARCPDDAEGVPAVTVTLPCVSYLASTRVMRSQDPGRRAHGQEQGKSKCKSKPWASASTSGWPCWEGCDLLKQRLLTNLQKRERPRQTHRHSDTETHGHTDKATTTRAHARTQNDKDVQTRVRVCARVCELAEPRTSASVRQ